MNFLFSVNLVELQYTLPAESIRLFVCLFVCFSHSLSQPPVEGSYAAVRQSVA